MMNFNNICRFCMAVDEPMYNIFEDSALKSKAEALLPNLKILFDDSLPRHVCKHCIYQLNAAYKFKIKCEHSDFVLRQHIDEMQNNKTPETNQENGSIPQEEIQIDSDDDVGSIPEPLVVLSSSAGLEDEDPLDLGHDQKSNVFAIGSCKNTSNVAEDSNKDKLTNNLDINYQQISNSEQTVNKNGIYPLHQISEKCSELGPTLPVPEHFLNESCDGPSPDSLQCPVCGLMCASRNRLDIHLGEHEGETPYICPICNKGFGRGGGLKAHMKLHSGEKPHVCTVCNKAFSLKGNLKVHSRLHTGEKPFQCLTCMKAFTQKISLTKHQSVHKQQQQQQQQLQQEQQKFPKKCYTDVFS